MGYFLTSILCGQFVAFTFLPTLNVFLYILIFCSITILVLLRICSLFKTFCNFFFKTKYKKAAFQVSICQSINFNNDKERTMRKIILHDKQEVEFDDINCVICLAIPANIRLNCGHFTLCLGCIRKMNKKMNNLGSIQCPICKVKCNRYKQIKFGSKGLDL